MHLAAFCQSSPDATLAEILRRSGVFEDEIATVLSWVNAENSDVPALSPQCADCIFDVASGHAHSADAPDVGLLFLAMLFDLQSSPHVAAGATSTLCQLVSQCWDDERSQQIALRFLQDKVSRLIRQQSTGIPIDGCASVAALLDVRLALVLLSLRLSVSCAAGAIAILGSERRGDLKTYWDDPEVSMPFWTKHLSAANTDATREISRVLCIFSAPSEGQR